MSAAPGTPDRSGRVTFALLLATATTGTFAFVATLFQTPGLEGPVQIAPFAVVVTVLAVAATPLVRWADPLGYAAATAAGAVAVVGIALYLTGAFGPTRVAPAAYLFALLGALLVASSVVGWRGTGG